MHRGAAGSIRDAMAQVSWRPGRRQGGSISTPPSRPGFRQVGHLDQEEISAVRPSVR